MRDWIAVGVSVITLLLFVGGGVWYLGHSDEQIGHLSQQQREIELSLLDLDDDLSLIDRRLAYIEGSLGSPVNIQSPVGGARRQWSETE